MIIRPSNIEELRQLYIQIINGNHAIRLSPRNQSVLKSMLDAPSATATKSISELAQENNINISSITRLAQKLGFVGFPDLKNLFRQHLNQKKNFYSGQVEKHLLKGHSGSTEATQALQHVIQDEWSNVMVMADEFDDKMFTSVIALLANAQRIRVIGLRGSYPLAYYLNFYLNMIRDDVSLLGQAGHSWAEELAALKEGDLLVAIGFSPPTPGILFLHVRLLKIKISILLLLQTVIPLHWRLKQIIFFLPQSKATISLVQLPQR